MSAVRTIIKAEDGQWYVVSTVRLSIDHSFGHGPPQLFETMVFASSNGEGVTDWMDLDCDRYATEEEAQDGHIKMVEKWRYTPEDA
jgi:hypothetical protein